jgi:hypothetical protein
MPRFISATEQKKLEIFLRTVLQKLRLKTIVFLAIIIPVQQIALHKVKKIVKKSSTINPPKKDAKKIIFNPLDARYTPHSYWEGGLAKALQIRGHKVRMLICGGLLKHCVGHFTVNKPPNKWRCKNCICQTKNFYDIIGLPYTSYHKYISKKKKEKIRKLVDNLTEEEINKHKHKGVNVGYHALTSAQRYYKGGNPQKDAYMKVLRTELLTAIISTDIAEKVVKEEKPDALVTSHGCYSTWGAFAEYFENQGIRVHVWYSGYISNYVQFDIRLAEKHFPIYYNEIRKKKPLNKQEMEELNNFIKGRVKGQLGDTAMYAFSKKNIDLEKKFNFKNYKRTYAMFPNIAWDASMAVSEDTAFSNIYEWVEYTIDLFKNNPKYQLLLKVHPAERVSESKKTMVNFIDEKYEKLPDNIKLIKPDTTISAYTLFPYLHAGIMYTGTLCIEMALHKVPVIMVGGSRYSSKKFTYYAKSKEEYNNFILKEKLSIDKEALEEAQVFAYFQFIKSIVPRPFLYYNNFLNLGWKINSFDDFAPGKDKYMDHFCNYVLNDGVYQNW